MRLLHLVALLPLVTACASTPPPPAAVASDPAPSATPPAAAPKISQAWNPLDAAKHCDGVKDVALCTQLIDLINKDQIVRRKWLADRENKEIQAEVDRVDEENMVEVARIIEKHGYPGVSLVGKRASGGAWTVIQHADIPTIKKYLDLMTRAVEAGELDGGLLATSVDRVRMAEGLPQVYGTQFIEKNGEMVPHPIEDEANVDARRAKVGLGTLAEYKEMMRQMYQKKP
jgi:hypothetical protein